MPDEIPEPGFYYHFKHDPGGPLNNYAYELIGTGLNTEQDETSLDAYAAIYRPLYEDSTAYRNGKLWCIRPLQMFMEEMTRDGVTVPRFHKITNPEIIAKLEIKRQEMYHS